VINFAGLSSKKGRYNLNWDRLEEQWKQRRGKAEIHWGKTMNDELAAVAGKYEEFVGKLQEKFGIANEEAKRKMDKLKQTAEQFKKSNRESMKLKKV
jgi:uncharacterized protein YjbJ (UPF0337 family)